MTTECPVCKKEYANRYIQAHITREAKMDAAHRKYRDLHKPNESQSELIIIDPLDQLMADLEKNWAKPVYKETPSQIAKTTASLLEEISKSIYPEPPKNMRARKLKVTVIKPKRSKGSADVLEIMTGYLRNRRARKLEVTIGKPGKIRDPEDTLGIITALPVVVAVLLVLYKLATNYQFFIDWTQSDIAQLYFWVIVNPTQAVSIIILVMTGLLVALAIFLIHQLVWRLCFKDLQVRYLKKDTTTGELRAVGTSKIGRMYLAIGSGFWDRVYRRLAKKPVPEVTTIYFKRRGFVNPFKVLASCEKGYLKDPDRSMLVIDGLFKRTLIATHLRRDTENHSTVYWFEGGDYEAIDFDSKWYEDTHRDEIKVGLSMVGKACGMDSSIQKDQMRTSISFMPTDLIAEQKRVWELKKIKMQKPQPELSR